MLAVLLTGLLAVALTGCGGGHNPERTRPSDGPDLSGADLWLSFDTHDTGTNGTPVFPDAAGGPATGEVVSADGGAVELVAGASGSGSAVGFPAKCDQDVGCPRAMVEVKSTPALDPDDDDFEFGATVWLEADQTTKGSNILQKGRFGTDGGQWKLQVDGDEGEPSCVVRGSEQGAEPLVVHAKVSIADEEWHRVTCRRDADGVSIDVDGQVEEKDGATGSVANEWPVRIGAPGVGEGDDQFHGRIDDAFLSIDR